MADGRPNTVIKLAKPGKLADAVQRLFKDALVLLPEKERQSTDASTLAYLRERLHLSDFSRWKKGSLKYDKRRSGRPSEVRYTPLEFTKRLISLLKGDIYFEDSDKERERVDRKLAKDLVQHWKRPQAPEDADDILVLLAAHQKMIAEEIARLVAESKGAERNSIALAAANVRQVAPIDNRVPFDQDRGTNGLRATDAHHREAGEDLIEAEAFGSVRDRKWNSVAPVIRICVTPLGTLSPRPVNLLMPLGVSRLAAVAVTIGVDAGWLAENLGNVESMLARIEGEPYAPRAWHVGSPTSWGAGGARGAVWEVTDGTSVEEIWRALTIAFGRPHGGCGNVVVMALAEGSQATARKLAEISVKAGMARGSSGPASVPIYLWQRGEPEASADVHLLSRIRHCVETGTCDDRSTDVRTVFRMRLYAAATLVSEWDSADGEQIRLHDLSLLAADNSNLPDSLDEMRAVDLIARIPSNQNLLYALPFLPVSEGLISALATAPELTRAVAGLLTPAEMQARRPAWRRPVAEGYRPAPALAPTLAG
jgi:hypothetical protein